MVFKLNICPYVIKNPSCFPKLKLRVLVPLLEVQGSAGFRCRVQAPEWCCGLAGCTQIRGCIMELGSPHMQGKVLVLCVKPGCEFSADLVFHI